MELRPLRPPAISAASKKVEFVPAGANLDVLSELIIDGGDYHHRQRLADEASHQSINLLLAGDPSPGLYQLRLRGRFGVSNPRPLLLTQQAIRSVNAMEHTDPALALPAESSLVYSFELPSRQKCFFRISLAAGDVLRCGAYARQLDSQAIPNLQLYGPQQLELQRGRAVQSWPAEIEFKAPAAGDYLLAINDLLYRGGEDFACLLEFAIGSEDLSTAPSQDLKSQALTMTSLELDRLLRPSSNPSNPELSWRPCSSVIAGHSSTLQKIESVEELVDSTSLPFVFQGNLNSGTRNFDLRLTAQQEVCFDVHSNACQQLTDPRLIIYRVSEDAPKESSDFMSVDRSSLKLVAENDDRQFVGGPEVRLALRDPYLQFKPAEAGSYRIQLSDMQAGRRPFDATLFRIEARTPNPGFRLIAFYPYPHVDRGLARPKGNAIMSGGTLAIRVIAIRQDGFTSAIRLNLNGLPDGLRCQPSLIPADASEASLIIEADEQIDAWCGPLAIVGHEASDDLESIRAGELQAENLVLAEAATVWRSKSATRNNIESRLTNTLYAATTPQDLSPITTRVGEDSLVSASPQSRVSIPIRLQRRDNGKVACLLRPKDLPKYASIAEINIAADAGEATATLTIANDAPESHFTFWLENEFRVKWQKNPEAAERAEANLKQLRDQLEATDQETERKRLSKNIAEAEALLEQLRKASAAQDISVWVPSNLVHVQISKKP